MTFALSKKYTNKWEFVMPEMLSSALSLKAKFRSGQVMTGEVSENPHEATLTEHFTIYLSAQSELHAQAF